MVTPQIHRSEARFVRQSLEVQCRDEMDVVLVRDALQRAAIERRPLVDLGQQDRVVRGVVDGADGLGDLLAGLRVDPQPFVLA